MKEEHRNKDGGKKGRREGKQDTQDEKQLKTDSEARQGLDLDSSTCWLGTLFIPLHHNLQWE